MATINYDAIAQELERGLQDVEQKNVCLAMNKPTRLKEFYTLGFSSSRQSGKTTWLIERLLIQPHSRLIVINTALQEDLIRRLMTYQYVDRDGMLVTPTGVVKVSDEVTTLIRSGGNVLNEATRRVFTSHQLKARIDGDIGFIHPVTHLYIDGHMQVFDRIRSNKYYTWLAKLSEQHILTWLID